MRKSKRKSAKKNKAYVSGRCQLVDETSTTLISAVSGKSLWLYHVIISNASPEDCLVSILDGTTVKWSVFVAASGGGAVLDLRVPLQGTSSNAWKAKVDSSGWANADPNGVYVTGIALPK